MRSIYLWKKYRIGLVCTGWNPTAIHWGFCITYCIWWATGPQGRPAVGYATRCVTKTWYGTLPINCGTLCNLYVIISMKLDFIKICFVCKSDWEWSLRILHIATRSNPTCTNWPHAFHSKLSTAENSILIRMKMLSVFSCHSGRDKALGKLFPESQSYPTLL